MATITPITKSEFSEKRWQRTTNYRFAAGDNVAPLVLQELPKAAITQPIAFILNQDQAFPVALQGFKPGQNLLVTPEGKWRVGYIPALYRGYPFSLAKADDGQQLLCIDSDSGLVSDSDGNGEGEPFFTDSGEPTPAIQDILNFLGQLQRNREVTLKICAVLQQHQLIEPWPLSVKTNDGEKTLQGLHRIAETTINQLDTEPFEELRQVGALPLIYCQLLSMQHLPNLVKLATKLQPKAEPELNELPDIDKLFGKEDDLFRFE